MLKFKIGDTVKITLGKDKGRAGKIEKIIPKKESALVPGINIYKKHLKGQQGQKGGIYEIPRPLSFSKIALICPKCNKVTRVGISLVDQQKRRVCKKCGKEIDK
ncbi:50S ribosomal protein L24 [Candidatus Woesebacteria bacterium RIFCSPLOWO2_01_FULL_39_61]|uniref:Large ribosomal subunit protein uL24 n=2 Tax=Microgenomates group TaxID=1794810 RepID=A0A0H4T878_9BACT|nr:50S ribosomal protein L24, large subunit ribosomal protein L24 [uncultured Microgenomates bacterium Rifle_16ft_4_minimus_37836]OGM28077.1 MAG: 50S ribosomal protein L24 [Candidatus Woesebacteria bacterium RIFCSPHIGHO2_01_FULL_39_95]OGM34065.1 MAG: 50S ribosomal protein L24 [Candidatus Woesebacteria bacterium RIFCSPHIGHO2_02_FULL_39_13]OGM38324.1 MAG: 50S ribosomal protein L24 [Candidatus Woesebacteria bacterium RIFCSPHIGHO2_12_FULL_40_20]OGM67787.1 MAG: 50S ribosomal protein L24 [Candidatus 